MAIAVLSGSPALGGIDIEIWRDTNRPRPIWAFDMDIAGSVMVLSVSWGWGGFEVASEAGYGDPDYGTLTVMSLYDILKTEPRPPYPAHRDTVRWEFTDAAVKAMPLGRIARGCLYRVVPDAPGRAGERRLYRGFCFIVHTWGQAMQYPRSQIAYVEESQATAAGVQFAISEAIALLSARKEVSDAAYGALPTDRTIAYISLSRERTMSLPFASEFPVGTTLIVVDESGNCSEERPIIVQGKGLDTIAEQPSVTMASPFQKLAFTSNGGSLWTVV